MRANDEGNSPKKPATTADEITNSFAPTSARVRMDRDFLKQMYVASLKSDEDDRRKNIFGVIYKEIDSLLKAIEDVF